MKPTSYRDPNRLADVMALIQVLAQDPRVIRTDHGLSIQLRGDPTSQATSWTDLAANHREFFRVRPSQDETAKDDVALIWRHAVFKQDGDKGPPLEPESTAKLLEIAVSLHDHEIRRTQRFAYLVPIATAIIGLLGALLIVLIKMKAGAA